MKRKVIFIAILVAFLIIGYNLFGQIISTLKSGERLDLAAEKLHQLEIKNRELKKRLEQVKSPEFIEQQSRDKLGLVREGETLIVIPEERIDQILSLNKKMEEVKLPNPLGWWKLFFK